MNRTHNLLAIYLVSGVIGLISEFLGAAKISYLILLILIIIDTLTGLAKAIKLKHFNSKVLLRFLKKLITYTTAFVTVRLLEIGILTFYKTTMMSQIIAAYLIITEAMSILEHVTILGVPIPANFAKILIGYIRIPGFAKMMQCGQDIQKDITEIEDIIQFQIPVIRHSHMRRLLEIKFEVWKKVVVHIDEGLNEKLSGNEVIYYKTMALIENGFKDMEERWIEEIPQECIDVFKSWHQNRVNAWLNKVQEICYSSKSLQDKKKQIIESIIVILYQTIIDAQKGMNEDPKCKQEAS